MQELVSVIIPTYKTNSSLKRAIESVLTQTYSPIEIVVVDDNGDNCYRHNAEEIVEAYSGLSNFKYIQHDTNRNGSAARNTGVLNCHGDFVSFLDDDDFYYPDKIEKEMDAIRETGSDFCVCYYNRNGILRSFDTKKDYSEEIFFCKTTPQTSSFLIKRKCFDAIGGFDESYFRHQDYEFLLRAEEVCDICVVEEPLYELCNNGVVNVPDGRKMELLKNKFLNDFGYLIEEKGYSKDKVTAKQFSFVAFAYLKKCELKDFFRIVTLYKSNDLYRFVLKRMYESIHYKLKGY